MTEAELMDGRGQMATFDNGKVYIAHVDVDGAHAVWKRLESGLYDLLSLESDMDGVRKAMYEDATEGDT